MTRRGIPATAHAGLATLMMLLLAACSDAPPPPEPAGTASSPVPPDAVPALPGEGEPPPNVQPVRLHFADEMDRLAPEMRDIDAGGTLADRLRRTVEALFAGPSGRLRRVIPPGTRLRALYLDPRGIVTLDLDATFARGLTEGSSDALLAVWSVVNTLAVSFAEVRQVKLLIEGEERRDLGGHLDLSRPLTADMSLLAGPGRP